MIPMKKKKWLLLLIPAVLILAAALVWFLYLSPRMALSNAADDALSKLEQRLAESPVPILAKGYDESGRNSTSLELAVSDGVQYDMQVQTDLTANQILADGTIRIDGKTLNLSAYLDKEFAAITSEDLFKGGYYGITYDTFSSDVRSFPLLSRLIPSATLSKLDSSVEKLQEYMNRTRQIPQLPEVQEEDIHKLILGLLVLKSDVHKEALTVDGQSLECLRFDYSATGEQAGTLLGYLMDTGGLSQGDITASFYLCDKTLVAVRCDGRAGENRAALRLDMGQDAARGDVSIAVEKLENGMSGFLTQPVLSAQAVENLRKARQTLGERAKILAGIMPVVSQRNAIFMENEINGIHVEEDIIQRFAGLDREQGEALGLEVSMQMAREALPYADGFYLMTPFNRVALMERLIARLKTELLDAEG